MSYQKLSIFLLLIFLLLTLTGCFGKFFNTPALNDQTGNLSLEPSEITLTTDEEFTVSLITPSVQDLKAYSITLDYDPQLLRLDEVNEGSFFSSGGDTFFYHDIDNQQGSVLIDCAILGRDLSVSGQGTLATLSFRCLHSPEAEINFGEVITLDTYGKDVITSRKGALIRSR